MKIAFFGSPHLCLSFLEKMKEESFCPSLVITNPDKPVGRKQTITPTPVKKWAERYRFISCHCLWENPT